MKDFEGKAHYPVDLESLPKGWACTFVGEVCSEVQSGFASGEHNSAGNGVPHLRPMNIDRSGRIDMSVIKSVAADVDARRLHLGDVLFNNTNSPVLVGKTAAVSRDGDLAFSNHMTRLRPWPEFDYEFLAHQLHYLWMGGYFLHRCSKHVNQASISGETLALTVPVVVPPAREQRRIVDAIDSYLTRLDNAVASLERVQAKLKAYRASVLKAAVEGRLVPTEASLARSEKRHFEPAEVALARILKERRRRWEEAELAKLEAVGKTPKDDKWKANYKEPVGPNMSTLPRLPEGWCWATVDQLSRSIFYGSSAKASQKGEVPVIRMGNIVDGALDLTELKFLPSGHEEFPDLLLQPGDLLFNRTNSAELVGKSAIYHGAPTSCSFASYLICVRVLHEVESDWICHAINSLYGRLWIASVVTQQVGQANVNGTKLRAFAVPLPPLVEQQRLLSLMDELFSKCGASRASVGIELRRVSRLRQSILNWAFEGKLVDQDPNDEPAEKLLGRIRAERASATPVKKSRHLTGKGAV